MGRVYTMTGGDALRFLQAGGAITLTEWARLDYESRGILSELGQALRVNALIEAQAAQTPDGVASIVEPYDGGAAKDDLVMQRAMTMARKAVGS